MRGARPPRRVVRRRRLVALAGLVLAALVAAGAFSYTGRDAAPPPPPPPPPPPKPFRVVFPEGFTRAQMAGRVDAVVAIARQKRNARVAISSETYLAASRRAMIPCWGRQARTNLEGFLFPATYDFLRRTTSRKLVIDQIEAFCRNWRSLDLAYARSKNLTPYDVLIIASMIEKEAVVPAERKLVSAVIYNRLRNRMTLGIDATLRYGLDIPPTESIRQSQLDSDDPYNTRRFAGLPPTPIANPGLASLRAAANPAQVDYLYFARKADKRHHFFTASEAEFTNFLRENGYLG
jgi:UPF0755 protein